MQRSSSTFSSRTSPEPARVKRPRAALVGIALPALALALTLPMREPQVVAHASAQGEPRQARAVSEPHDPSVLRAIAAGDLAPVAEEAREPAVERSAPPKPREKEPAQEPAQEPAPVEEPAPPPPPPPPPPPFPVGPSKLFATFQELHLWTPSAQPVLVGFHEAYYGNAFGMLPMGEAQIVDNPRFGGTPNRPTGQPYAVLSSRGRRPEPTSAADIVMRPGEAVRAVVTGTVVDARNYVLYGKYPDGRVSIRSAERPDLVVTMLHVTGLQVQVGQQVLAGDTVVAAGPTQFPFVSQIDRYLGGNPHPHVHIEIKQD